MNDSVNDRYEYVRLKATIGIGIINSDYEEPLIWDDIGNTDLADYDIKIQSNIGVGNSGSPAYLLVSKRKRGKIYKTIQFAGLVFSADFNTRHAYILRPEWVTKSGMKTLCPE